VATGEENAVLTVGEVADFLRVDVPGVRGLIESGELAGFRVAGEWRVPWIAVEDFLRRGMAATQQEALARSLSNPGTWARVLEDMPEHAAWLTAQDFEDGTMGAWLQDALRTGEAEREASNVVPLDRPRRD